MKQKTILVVEDNQVILRTNCVHLELEGYRVLKATSLASAQKLLAKKRPDLILLDILLPDGNGIDFCRQQFKQQGAPILFLSALTAPEDVVAGLRAGGDDYLTKPYLMDELLARVEAILRRTSEKSQQQYSKFSELKLNKTAGRVYLDGVDLLLTPKELSLLEVLLAREGQFVSSQELYELVWGIAAQTDLRTLRVRITNLRKKLSACPKITIEQKRGFGYCLQFSKTADSVEKVNII